MALSCISNSESSIQEDKSLLLIVYGGLAKTHAKINSFLFLRNIFWANKLIYITNILEPGAAKIILL